MNHRQLQIFLNLAETLNFARAAELSHLSQPALTLAVQSLERSLGGKLFSRTTRRVRLTPEGEMLLPRARQLLAEWEDTEEMLRYRFTLKRGRVTVAAMPSFAGALLPSLLFKYRRAYPLIDVAIQDVIHEQVVELVQKGRVEMGICFEAEAAEHLEFTPLFRDRFIAIVPPGAKFSKKSQVTWAELLKFPFITLQRPSTVRRLPGCAIPWTCTPIIWISPRARANWIATWKFSPCRRRMAWCREPRRRAPPPIRC